MGLAESAEAAAGRSLLCVDIEGDKGHFAMDGYLGWSRAGQQTAETKEAHFWGDKWAVTQSLMREANLPTACTSSKAAARGENGLYRGDNRLSTRRGRTARLRQWEGTPPQLKVTTLTSTSEQKLCQMPIADVTSLTFAILIWACHVKLWKWLNFKLWCSLYARTHTFITRHTHTPGHTHTHKAVAKTCGSGKWVCLPAHPGSSLGEWRILYLCACHILVTNTSKEAKWPCLYINLPRANAQTPREPQSRSRKLTAQSLTGS